MDKKRTGITWMVRLLPLTSLILVTAIFGIATKGKLFEKRNLTSLLNNSYTLVICTLSALFLYAQGAVDFTMAAVFALSAILAALISGKFSIFLVFAAAVAVGALCSIISGTLVTKARIPLFIALLSFSNAITGILDPISGNTSVAIPFLWTMYDSVWLKILSVIVAGVLYLYLYNYTALGKQARAIGASPEAARQSGVRLDRVKIISFLIIGLTVGVCAFLSLLRVGSGSSNTGQMIHFNVMISFVLGGIPSEGGAEAKFSSAFLGAVTFSVISFGLVLLGLSTAIQNLVLASVFIAVLILTDKLKAGVYAAR